MILGIKIKVVLWDWKFWIVSVSLIGVVMVVSFVFVDENIIISYGYNFFGDLKYLVDY